MIRLAIAVPTYNRCEDIDLFIRYTSFLEEFDDTDLLIYDSSENDYTKRVVFNHNMNRKGTKIVYHSVSSDTHPNEKFFNIYIDLYQKYDYIWIIHDHTVFTENAFSYIRSNLDRGIDFFYLKIHSPAAVTACSLIEETDIEDFFYKAAWFLGKVGAAMVRTQTFLMGIDWDMYKVKYLKKELINFSHVGMYFERLAEMENPQIYTMCFPREYFTDNHMYKPLAWKNDLVRISTQCWGGVIEALPGKYKNKDTVIKTIDEHLLTKYRLLELKGIGAYGFADYLKYKKWIGKVFPRMRFKAFFISVLPWGWGRGIYLNGFLKRLLSAKKKGIPVYIYGAGRHGYECLKDLEYYGIKSDGFVVTRMQGNPVRVNEYSVDVVDDVLVKEKKVLFVLAVMDIYKDEIISFLEKKRSRGYEVNYIDY